MVHLLGQTGYLWSGL